MKVEDIARVCHETNRSLCLALGEVAGAAWALAGVEIRASAKAGVEYALAHPEATPEEMHERWCAARRAAGWSRGPVKDEHLREHPLLAPYAELGAVDRTKDRLFLAVVRALAPLVD